MSIKIEKFNILTKGFNDTIDLTSKIETIVLNSNVINGIASISSTSSCCSIITMELEPGLKDDLSKVLETIIPINKLYEHDLIWHEGNAFSHLKASLLGGNITLTIEDKRLCLGQYQRIFLIDFDTKAMNREIITTFVY